MGGGAGSFPLLLYGSDVRYYTPSCVMADVSVQFYKQGAPLLEAHLLVLC